MSHTAHFIAGEWRQGNGPLLYKHSPEDQQILWHAKSADDADVKTACDAARKAFPRWARLPVDERMAIVARFATFLAEAKETLAALIAQETSKPLWETRTEVQAMIGKAAISQEAWSDRKSVV